MKLVFADNSELEIVTCNESYRLSENSEFQDHQTLSIGLESDMELSELKGLMTTAKLAKIMIVNQSGSRSYTNVSINSLTRTITDRDSLCYITFDL